MAVSPYARIMARTVKRPDGHWIYGGAGDKDGYGYVRTGSAKNDSRRMEYAHEIVWRHHHGSAPDGDRLQINHKCGIRKCVNPAHLEVVTRQANIDHRDARQAALARARR